MLKILAVLMALVSFTLPVLAQTAPPPAPSDQDGTPPPSGWTPGTLFLGVAGAGLLGWGIYEATKNKCTSAC
jgi:hypothetical protein